MNISSRVKNDQYKDEDTENINEEETSLRTVIQEIKKIYILLLTSLWKKILYVTACDLGTQHYYIMYNKNTEPKYYTSEIKVDLYQDQKYVKGPDIHAH